MDAGAAGRQCRRLAITAAAGGDCQIVERHTTDGATWSAPSVAATWTAGQWMPSGGLAISDSSDLRLVHTLPRASVRTDDADVYVTSRQSDGAWISERVGHVDLRDLGISGLGLFQGAAGSRRAVSGAAVRSDDVVAGSTDLFIIRSGCPVSAEGARQNIRAG